MALSGQGDLSGIVNRKPPINGRVMLTTTSSVNIINFRPVITWKFKTIPTKIPDSGSNGGAISLNEDTKNQNYFNPDGSAGQNGNLNHKIYVQGVGHGVGVVLPQNPGPVLLGTLSFSPSSDLSLWIIAGILLLIMATIWAITHLICYVRKSQKTRRVVCRWRKKFSKDEKDSWSATYHGGNKSKSSTIDQLSLIKMNTEIQNSQTVKSSFGSTSKTRQLFSSGLINKDYTQSLRISIPGSVKPNGLRSQSSTSLWSYQTSIVDGTGLINGSFSGPTMNHQIIENGNTGLIFTISDLKCPNTWFSKDSENVAHCENSQFEECLEVYLLMRESLLVGKMKNIRHKRNTGDFTIQIWNAFDGTLLKSVPHESLDCNIACDAVCSLRDEFLVLIRQGEIVVWNLTDNEIKQTIKLANIQTWKGKHAIQATQDMQEIIIMIVLPLTGVTHLYTYNFDSIINGSSNCQFKSFPSQKTFYSLISNNSILIAGSTCIDIVLWNFSNNSESILSKNDEEQIQRILNSPNGDLILIQTNNGISIWQSQFWLKISEIYISSTKICSMVFSKMIGSTCFLAAALEDGSICIYNAGDGKLEKIFQINIPIVYMVFGYDNVSLIAMADRASHYKLFIFDI